MDIAKPLKCAFQVEQLGNELILRRRTGSLGLALLSALWLTGWTAGCVVLAGLVIRQPTLQHALFAVPFWSSWACVSWFIILLIFRVEQLRIGVDGLEYRTRALITLSKRHVPLHEIQEVADYSAVTDGESGRTEHGLKLVTLGRPIRFGQGIDPIERLWLADLLRKSLPSQSRPPTPKKAVPIEVVDPGATPPAGPPSDSLIRMESDWDGTVFVRPGAFSLGTLGAMTFMNLFWNGVTSIFVFQLFAEFHWFLFVFLIPFEAFGLAIFGGWLVALTAHFWVETWRVGPVEVVSRVTFLGWGRTHHLAAGELERIELRKGARSRQKWVQQTSGDQADDTPFTLGFVSRGGHDLLAIDDLTEGEARWLGGQAAQQLKDTLAKIGEHSPTFLGPGPLWDPELDR